MIRLPQRLTWVLLACIFVLCAQSLPTGVTERPNYARQFHTATVAVPTASTDVFPDRDIEVDEIVLSNTSTTLTTSVTFWDKQSTPKVVLSVSILPNASGNTNNYIVDFKGQWFPGGLTWQATNTGVNGSLRGRF